MRTKAIHKKSQIFLLSKTNVQLKICVSSVTERLKEYASKGDMKSICHQLSTAFDLNYFKNKDVLLDTLKTVAHNFHVKGNRFEDPVKRFYEESFNDLIFGNIENCPPDSTCGTKIYLKVIWHYIEILASPVMQLKGRISYAGLVVKFLAVWRNFVVWEEDLTFKKQLYFQSMLPGYHIIVPLQFL